MTSLLYFSLIFIAGSDDLSLDKKDKFVKVAKSLGVNKNKIKDIVNAYLLEVKFVKQFSKLMGTASL